MTAPHPSFVEALAGAPSQSGCYILEDARGHVLYVGRAVDMRIEDEDEDEDEEDGAGSSFPNLKYAKPKYKDVQSVLRYIESDAQNGGLKLVIMNFND